MHTRVVRVASNENEREASSAVASSPQQVWDELLIQIRQQASMAWVRNLVLRRIDEHTAHIDTLPGAGDLKRFADQNRREQLAKLIAPIIGRPIRVEFDERPPVATDDSVYPKQPSDADDRPPIAGQPVTQADRQQALQLPIVKTICKLFDVTLVDVRYDRQQ